MKSKKIKLYLTAQQRQILRQWEGTSRFTYNQTVGLLKQPDIKASWFSLKGDLLKQLPEWAMTVPYQVKSIAIRDACSAVKQAKLKCKQTGIPSVVRFRAKRAPERSIFIPKSAISAKGVYHTLLGAIRASEVIPESCLDSRLLLRNGEYFLAVPYKATIRLSENQARVVALDPGIRTFITFFAEKSFGKLGTNDIGRIYRLCHYMDKLSSRISTSKSKYRTRRARLRMSAKIRDLINELHHKVALFLVTNFDIILLPLFESSRMVIKGHRKLNSKAARAMLTFSHYRFKKFLEHKAREYGKLVVTVDESYTSKTVSWTGELVPKLGSARFIKDSKGVRMDRDLNGARNILIKSLSDSTFREELNLLGCSVNIC